ncbi:MAG: 23S rRNA (adenine(2503)-C(2))-methyltransferase RlmN [Bacteroidales bacterium]|nr:23S rRNA (adenine(2503)-C(2))-methyltransferase RlmN [Bacteroidales bacterium]
MKEKLLGKSLNELKELCKELSLPSYSAKQIADWLYRKRVSSIEQMTNLSLKSRELLSERFEVGGVMPSYTAVSRDGTKKYLFDCGSYVEAVMIPDEERYTLCVSSQRGCKMGCKFCMTGRQGFKGNLDAAQILSQFFFIEEAQLLTNAVFMGMGEPLDNLDEVLRAIECLTAEWGVGWSPKRITLSSIGLNNSSAQGEVSPLERYLDGCKAHLAISLHNPFAKERAEIMPSERPFPLQKSLEIIKRYDFTGQRRVSFEYIMFKGINDSLRHAKALVGLLKGLECRVNLIRFHDIGQTEFQASDMKVIEEFKDTLLKAGITATLRASRGQDIEAACGMLSGIKERNKTEN